ncbi:hypothetical protein Hs30E_06870 [Lactococcus hodotermopsidis]|uniref:adenosine deaminase n=1 Tax=Pseudolactococcus hodotermopsidis TaxID=2709157 RepID=A0A6A0BBD6_9LACT|nr:adenosine deaminase [Lactococcus hodotermopsidis]GFH42136.1 hypothetical protein Hs30E_06870 [Lactococcus hodotermopsidis]
MKTSIQEIKQIPKIELHCHLDGSISMKMIRTLAKNAGIKIPLLDTELQKRLTAPTEGHDLRSYLKPFDFVLPLLQTEQNLALAAYDVIEQCVADAIRYIEIRFAPTQHLAGGLTMIQAVQAVGRGLEAGKIHYGIQSNLILSGMRNEPVASVMQLVDGIVDGTLTNVAGFDLAGEEVAGFVSKFAPVLEKVKANNIPLTLHAGECGCAQNVLDSVAAGASRIGHGVAINAHPETWATLAENKTTFELAPTSNFQTGAVDKLENYPFKKLFDAGVRVTINTDNRTVSGTTLNDEYLKLAEWYDFNEIDFRQMNNYAFEASFMSDELRTALGKEFGAVVKAEMPTLEIEERIDRLDAVLAQKVLEAKKEVFNRAKLTRKIHFIRAEGKSMSVYLTKYLISSIVKFIVFGAAAGVVIINFALMIFGSIKGPLGEKTFAKLMAKNPISGFIKGLSNHETRLLGMVGLVIVGIVLAFALIKLFKMSFKINATDDYLVKYSFHKRTAFAAEVRALLEKQDYYDLKANREALQKKLEPVDKAFQTGGSFESQD